MYSLAIFLLLVIDSVLTAQKCDSSAYKLSVVTVRKDKDDALERLRRSAKQHSVDLTAVNLPESSIRGTGSTEV